MKVKINTHGNALPEVHGEWIDLCTAEDVTLDFLEYKIISLGVSIEIPAGYYAHVVPRSSTFGKWGILLANSMGVIAFPNAPKKVLQSLRKTGERIAVNRVIVILYHASRNRILS